MNPPSTEKGKLPLPKHWPTGVQSAVLHIIGLAHTVMTYTRGWAANSFNARIRLQTEVERLTNEVALLHEELRIKDERMRAIPAHRRPHYAPVTRMAILEFPHRFCSYAIKQVHHPVRCSWRTRVHQGLAGKTLPEQRDPSRSSRFVWNHAPDGRSPWARMEPRLRSAWQSLWRWSWFLLRGTVSAARRTPACGLS